MPAAFPQFKGNETERLHQCIDFVNKTIQLKRLNAKDLLFFAMFSPAEILQRKKAYAGFPCLDLSLVAAETLIQNGIPSKLVIERRHAEKIMEVHHYFLELQIEGKPMHIAIGRGLHLAEGLVSSMRKVRMHGVKGEKIEGEAQRKMEINYSSSHANEPAYQVLGFHSRKYLRHFLNWTLPHAARVLLKYNSTASIRRIAEGNNKEVVSEMPKFPIGKRIMRVIMKPFRRRRRS